MVAGHFEQFTSLIWRIVTFPASATRLAPAKFNDVQTDGIKKGVFFSYQIAKR